jgi:hypothetical protein
MRNKIYKIFLLLSLFAAVSIGVARADDPVPDPPDPGGNPTGGGPGPVGSPIGGGVEILIVMGISYAGLKIYGIRKKVKDIHGDVI